MATAKKPEDMAIAIPPIRKQELLITIRSEGIGLLCNRMTEEAKTIISHPAGTPKPKPKHGKPEDRAERSLYIIQAGEPGYVGGAPNWGFPGSAIFKSLVTAGGRFVHGLQMTRLRGLLRVPFGLIPLRSTTGWQMRWDIVVPPGQRTPMPAYRAWFPEWEMDLRLFHDADLLSAAEVVNLFQRAGFSIGIGAWRPECNGEFGCFNVEPAG